MISLAFAFFTIVSTNAVVLRPVASMYASPDSDASVVSQAIYGSNVEILEERERWAKIRTSDGYSGWTPLSDLKSSAPYGVAGKVGEVQSLFAHIYREPSVTRHAPLLTVPFETKLEISGAASATAQDNDHEWFPIKLVDGSAGWIQAGDIVFDPPKLGIPEMLALAKRFLGFPYTWGGRSSFGYDCSGFTQMLERRRGVLIPRDAQPQADWSGVRQVERKDLEPGDLLFFGRSADHITHTGVYLGNAEFISATAYQTPMVRIDNLNDPHWADLLVAMRRVK